MISQLRLKKAVITIPKVKEDADDSVIMVIEALKTSKLREFILIFN